MRVGRCRRPGSLRYTAYHSHVPSRNSKINIFDIRLLVLRAGVVRLLKV